jgi:hypothetical protein
MKRLWFVEGMDGVGKTTLVRELQNRSGYAICGLVDRGPLSRVIWAEAHNESYDAVAWREWLESFTQDQFKRIGVLLLLGSWDGRAGAVLREEMAQDGYRGLLWTRDYWIDMQRNYVSAATYLSLKGLPVQIIDTEKSFEETLLLAATALGYTKAVFNTPAKYNMGEKERNDGRSKKTI